MTSYIIRRLLLIIPTVFLALSFLFFLFFTLPGDPARLIAGGADRSIDDGRDRARQRALRPRRPAARPIQGLLGAHHPWDLGESFLTRRSVNDILGEKAVASIRLAIWAIIIEIVVGIPVGLLSAIRRYSVGDRLTTILTAAASAIPVFVLGFVLQWLFAVQPNKLGWPEWARLRTQGIGPELVGAVLHPHGRAVALPDPAGHHPGLRCPRRWRRA